MSNLLGATPLHLIARRGNTDNAGVLLSAGASVNARDAQGRTALHEAANTGGPEMVRFLLGAKADKGRIFGRPRHRVSEHRLETVQPRVR